MILSRSCNLRISEDVMFGSSDDGRQLSDLSAVMIEIMVTFSSAQIRDDGVKHRGNMFVARCRHQNGDQH